MGAGPDHHFVRSGEGLQTGREVRRFADHRLLLCRTLADQVTHNHLPAGDANPASEHFTVWRALLYDGLDHSQTCPDRPLGLVLVCAWPAEVHENAVAHVLGNEAVVVADLIGDASVIGSDHIA
jgi:hypothetical protein